MDKSSRHMRKVYAKKYMMSYMIMVFLGALLCLTCVTSRANASEVQVDCNLEVERERTAISCEEVSTGTSQDEMAHDDQAQTSEVDGLTEIQQANSEIAYDPNSSNTGRAYSQTNEFNSSEIVPKADDENETSPAQTPIINKVELTGSFNANAHSADYFKGITVTVVGENLTDENILTPEGLYWSDQTQVELISGTSHGNYDRLTFSDEMPTTALDAYSLASGTAGRITFVGKTRSGIDLDMLWTIASSDFTDWLDSSPYSPTDLQGYGIGFTGEQFFPGSRGNSIVAIYNCANSVNITYRIVRHGTSDEIPVLVSFISTDIDSAQGVMTDLANLVEIIPEESHLKRDGFFVYDTTPGAINLNGTYDLPRGGYLGVGFISHFTYAFFSPAPQRIEDVPYQYAQAVKYGLFGSALQARMDIAYLQHLNIICKDKAGAVLKKAMSVTYMPGEIPTYNIPTFSGYKLSKMITKTIDSSHFVIEFIYDKTSGSTKTSVSQKAPSATYRSQTKSVSSVSKANSSKSASYNVVYKPCTYPALEVKNHVDKAQEEAEAIDYFAENTGLDADDQAILFAMINEVRINAIKEFGTDNIDAVNHEIYNAIAYSEYSNDFLQKLFNDFGPKPTGDAYKKAEQLIKDIHQKSKYKIDFPHLATTLATSYNTDPWHQVLQLIAGYSFQDKKSNPFVNFVWLNSVSGDQLADGFGSSIDLHGKDMITDADAIIFKYDPEFQDKYADDNIKKYYSNPNLQAIRQTKYNAIVCDLRGVDNPETAVLELETCSMCAVGGIGISLMYLCRSVKKRNYIVFRSGVELPLANINDIDYKNLTKSVLTSKSKVEVNNKVEDRNRKELGSPEKLNLPSIQSLATNELNVVQARIKLRSKPKYSLAQKINSKVVQPIKNTIKNIGKTVNKTVKKVVQVAKKVGKVVNAVVKKTVARVGKAANKIATVSKKVTKTFKKVAKKVVSVVKKGISKVSSFFSK